MGATVQLYNAIRTELLPTPNKSHYTFNLRDMGKVVQGLMRADPKTLGTQQQVCFKVGGGVSVCLAATCRVTSTLALHTPPW